jgi:hypothetical protein
MRNRVVGSITLVMMILTFSSAALAQRGNAAPAAIVPHDPHDLNGVWLSGGGGGGAAAAGAPQPMTQWTREPLPLTAEGKAKMDSNKSGKGPRAVMPALGNDLLGDANPPGIMRTLVYGRPFEWIMTPNKAVMLIEWAHFWRQVWTDGRKVPEDPDPLWYGHSAGRWEGDTFVVDTVGLDSRAWLDEWGTPFSEETKIVERWRRLNRDNLELQITVTDPKYYTKPWTSDKRNYRLQTKPSPDAELLEVIFAPIDEQEFNQRIRNPAAGVKK